MLQPLDTVSPIKKRGPNFKDLTGRRFGRLSVLQLSDFRKGKHLYWHCKCSCGNTKDIASTSLLGNFTRSCGCLVFENRCNLQHGLTKSTEWRIWQDMKRRCYSPYREDYRLYGGRGIKVCDRWRSSFPAFLEDMGKRPIGLTLGRIDNDGDYEPNNCRWETALEQANNTRANRYITFRGITKTMAQWCRDLSIPYSRVQSRLDAGYNAEVALEVV